MSKINQNLVASNAAVLCERPYILKYAISIGLLLQKYLFAYWCNCLCESHFITVGDLLANCQVYGDVVQFTNKSSLSPPEPQQSNNKVLNDDEARSCRGLAQLMHEYPRGLSLRCGLGPFRP